MSSIISTTNKDFNPYDTIIDLMNQKDFRMLFESQFNDFSEIKSVILIMKTYHYLENLYVEQNGVLPSKNFMKDGIKKLMQNPHSRKFLVESTITFMKDEKSFKEIVDSTLKDDEFLIKLE